MIMEAEDEALYTDLSNGIRYKWLDKYYLELITTFNLIYVCLIDIHVFNIYHQTVG